MRRAIEAGPPRRVFALPWEGELLYIKRAARPALRSRLGFALLGALAWATRREILRPRGNPGGVDGLALEAAHLRALASRGVRVPEVRACAEDRSWIALSSIGESMGGALAAEREPGARRALLLTAARALAALHARGEVHGAPLPRNLVVTREPDAEAAIGFLDFEDESSSRMALAAAQARDAALLLWGASRYAARDPELIPLLLRAWRELAPPAALGELRSLVRFARRARTPLRPFLPLLGGDLRRASLTLDALTDGMDR